MKIFILSHYGENVYHLILLVKKFPNLRHHKLGNIFLGLFKQLILWIILQGKHG